MLPSEYAAAVKRVGVGASALLVPLWRRNGSWSDKLQRAALIVAAGQIRAASITNDYVASEVGDDYRLNASAFGGLASDGRPLASLMDGAAVAANRAFGRAEKVEAAAEADRAALAWLRMVAVTQVADAGRAAMRSSMAAWDMYGVRVANVPCCGRCAVLAGQVRHWRAGFQRHPGCDCCVAPKLGSTSVAEGDEIPLDQIRGLSKADREAIGMGADRTSVINAHRGMFTADIYGHRVKATTESTARRTSAFPLRYNPNTVRLRPEAILKAADGDRDEAIRLLKRFGYIR